MGPGAIGLLTAQTVKTFGCRVIVSGAGSDAERLEVAKKLGIDVTVNTQKEPLSACVNALTGGRGADFVFDCSGAQTAIAEGLSVLKRKGVMVQVGLTKAELLIPYALLPQRELSVRGTFGHNWRSWEAALKLLSEGKVDVKPLISRVFPIEEWEKAFEVAERQEGIKILIHPND
jgi:L-iditol 2-dehydrogenase